MEEGVLYELDGTVVDDFPRRRRQGARFAGGRPSGWRPLIALASAIAAIAAMVATGSAMADTSSWSSSLSGLAVASSVLASGVCLLLPGIAIGLRRPADPLVGLAATALAVASGALALLITAFRFGPAWVLWSDVAQTVTTIAGLLEAAGWVALAVAIHRGIGTRIGTRTSGAPIAIIALIGLAVTGIELWASVQPRRVTDDAIIVWVSWQSAVVTGAELAAGLAIAVAAIRARRRERRAFVLLATVTGVVEACAIGLVILVAVRWWHVGSLDIWTGLTILSAVPALLLPALFLLWPSGLVAVSERAAPRSAS